MKLITIKEHNERVAHMNQTLSTGIACPQCGKELQHKDHTRFLSSPMQSDVQCFGCGYKDRVFV